VPGEARETDPDPYPVEAVLTLELLGSGRAWILGQGLDALVDALLDFLRKLGEFPLCRRGDLDPYFAATYFRPSSRRAFS
jgi:hypothetical protein